MNYPQVALEFMNRDHAEFVTLLQKILDALPDDNASVVQLNDLLDELLAHTRRHFTEEEREMQATGFPPYPMHQGEHERVLGAMAAKISEWQSGHDKAALKAWLTGPVSEWFVNHVSTMDMMTARYIAACRSENPN